MGEITYISVSTKKPLECVADIREWCASRESCLKVQSFNKLLSRLVFIANDRETVFSHCEWPERRVILPPVDLEFGMHVRCCGSLLRV